MVQLWYWWETVDECCAGDDGSTWYIWQKHNPLGIQSKPITIYAQRKNTSKTCTATQGKLQETSERNTNNIKSPLNSRKRYNAIHTSLSKKRQVSTHLSWREDWSEVNTEEAVKRTRRLSSSQAPSFYRYIYKRGSTKSTFIWLRYKWINANIQSHTWRDKERED